MGPCSGRRVLGSSGDHSSDGDKLSNPSAPDDASKTTSITNSGSGLRRMSHMEHSCKITTADPEGDWHGVCYFTWD